VSLCYQKRCVTISDHHHIIRHVVVRVIRERVGELEDEVLSGRGRVENGRAVRRVLVEICRSQLLLQLLQLLMLMLLLLLLL
jgi:hypothetical protein